MTKKLTALAALVLFLLAQRPHAQGSGPQARIFFVDVGQGASTLIVSPTGKTLLVDGGPPGGGTKVAALLTTLGIPAIDYTVVTHYHIDHVSGITELLNSGRVAGTAFDNGDGADVQPPGTSTSATSTRGTYLNYVAATGRPGVTRATIQPGQAIDLGGGMRATCIVAGGRLLSGGTAAMTNQDLNTESISLLVEYNNFDYLVSGDLTGGGSTSTAKTPDVETYVGQMVGDVDVVQLNHHGSTTTSNQVFLSAVKAEVAVAQTGETNTFGHPNRETVNKYLNTPTTTGNSYGGTGVSPAVGTGPVFYQNEASPAGDDRVTQQGYTAAAAGHAGQGTLLLATDGTTNYSLGSFDDTGVQVDAALHTYPVDGVSAGVTTDFRPTVIAQTSPVLPLASEAVTVRAAVNDRESPISSVMLNYAVNGTAQSPIAMTLAGAVYQATIPPQPDGVRIDYGITATAGAQTTTSASGYFSGVAPIASLRALNGKGEPLYAGYATRIRGTVTASGFSPGTNDDYVQDATGAVNVFRSTDTPTVFTPTAPGQVVEVFGRIGFLGGRLRLDVTESVEKSASPYGVTVITPGPPPAPVATTIAALTTNPESFEGQFVSIANLSIVSGTIPATPQSIDAFATVTDGTGSFSLKIDKDTDIEGFTPAEVFTAVGIIQQDDYLRPFDAGYDITPRSRVDLGGAAPTPAPLLTIAEARVDQINNGDGTAGADFVPDRLNQIVRIQGTVSSIDFRGGNGIEYYIQDGGAGIDLFSTSLNAGPFAVGDTVEAAGPVTQFNGLTEVSVTAVTLRTHDGAPVPRIVTLAQLGDGGAGEAFEAQLVTVNNVHVVSGAFPAANASGNVTVTDGTANVVLRVDSDTDIDGTATPSGNFSVTALVGQFDVAPFDSGYQLLPRGLADIVAAAPTLTATPSAVAFGSVIVGSAATQSVTITNTNPFGVTLAPLTITGADAAQFSAGAPGATALAGGASTTVSVTFAPTSLGAKSATLNIASDGGSAVVGLTGTGQADAGAGTAIVISEFRTRGAGGGNDEFVELYNNSDAPIAIGGYKLRGSNAAGTVGDRATVLAGTVLPARGHFLFVNGAAAAGLVALANQTYGTGITDDGGIAITQNDNTILDQVGMSAAAAAAFREGTPLGPVTANLGNLSYERKAGGLEASQVDTNDNFADFKSGASDPQNLASTVTPGIGASPLALNFGTLAVGLTTSATVTVTNNTPAPVTLTSPFVIDGSDASAFSVSTPGDTTLAPGAGTTATVTFRPLSGGPKSATLLVKSTAGSRSIALSGTGSGGISVNLSDITFGTVTIGALVSAPITITNTDPSTVTLTPPFTITGTNAVDFSVSLPTATSLAPGASAGATVRFQPTSAGLKSAALTITSANGGSRTVNLTGNSACQVIAIAGLLPGGAVGVPYSQLLTASGGVAPYTFSIASGTLPGGLALAAGGLVSGTPGAAGSFTFTAQATAANSCSGIASYTVAIAPSTLTASPTLVSFGTVAVGDAGDSPVTLTNNSASTIVLSPIMMEGADADQFAVGAPAITTLPAGGSTTLPVSFLPTSTGVKTATLNITSTGDGSAPVTLTGVATAVSSLGTPVVISEFRTRGPNGANDEFVEIYNNTDAPIVIGGYTLRGSNSVGTASIRATVPAGTILPARSHYLFVNAAAGVPNVSLANQTYGTGITDDGGVALALPDTTVVDQAGMSAGSAYKEGTTLAPMTTTGVSRSYERRRGGLDGSQIDTNENASDFRVLSPSAPQNLASPITPAISVAPPLANFGNTAIGQTGSVTITITNNGTTAVTLTPPFNIVGAGAAAFSATIPGVSTLDAGATTTITVFFQPLTAVPFVATLTITSASGGSAIVPLRGTGTPGIAVTPTAVDFGDTALGSTSSATVTIANHDPTPVTLTPPFAITGPDAVDFTASAPSATILAPGEEATVALTFQPVALGGKSATLTISSVAGGTRTVSLAGNAVCAPIIIGGTLADGEFGFPYSGTFTASGGPAPFAFSLAGGALPGGLALDANGALTGTPTALGTSNFTVRAAAANTCSGTAEFAVTIRDTTPPALTLPGTITATAIAPSGAIVTYTATAFDLVDGVRPVTCTPASGSRFAIGTTSVSCSASDAHDNTASGSFNVTVTAAAQPGRMIGDGKIEIGAVTHSFDFFVQERAGHDVSAIRYRVKTDNRRGKDQQDEFNAIAVTGVTFFNVPGVSPGSQPASGVDTVTFVGTGRWNGRSGYRFEAQATDAGEPGRGRDSFAITIRDAAGHIVASVNSVITNGNVQSLRLTR